MQKTKKISIKKIIKNFIVFNFIFFIILSTAFFSFVKEIPKAQAAYITKNTGGLLVYADDTVGTPKYRTFDNTNGFDTEGSASSVGGQAIEWIRVATSPKVGKWIIVTRDAGDVIKAQVCDEIVTGISCGTPTTITATAGTHGLRNFDVAFEGSGDALLVYGTSTADELRKIEWTSSGGWANDAAITTTRTTGTVEWVELTSQGVFSDNIGIAYSDSNDAVSAYRWNGSSAADEATAVISSTVVTGDVRKFDVSFEGTSQDMLVVAAMPSGDVRTGTLVGTTWTMTTQTAVDFASAFIDLPEDNGGWSNYMSVFSHGVAATNTSEGWAWTGSAVTDGTAGDDVPPAWSANYQLGATSWFNLSKYNGVTVFSNNATSDDIDWWTINTAGAITDRTVNTRTRGASRFIDIFDYPDNDKVLLITGDANSDLWADTWNGAAVTNVAWTDLTSGGALETSLASATTDVIDFAFKRSNSIKGTTDHSDATGVIKIAINGVLDSAAAGDISNGTWSITPTTFPTTGQVVTVFIDGVTDDNESTAVQEYGGTLDLSMVLNKGQLFLGDYGQSSQSLSLTDINLYSCANDEDVLHSVISNALNVEGQTCSGSVNNSYTNETLQINSLTTLTLANGESITTEKLVNAGTFTPTGTTGINLAGTSGTLITNTGTLTLTGTTVALSGNGDATVNSASQTFNNLSITGTGTKTLGAIITISNNLAISAGTLDDGGYQITGNASGTLTMAASTYLVLGNATTSTTFPTSYTNGNITLNTSSTVVYNGSAATPGTWAEGVCSACNASELYDLAGSTDGTTLLTGVAGGYIYTSSDSGANWTEQTNSGARQWRDFGISDDGTKMVSAVLGGYIYTSTDSGVNWTERTNSGARNWLTVDSSADGNELIGAVYSTGYIYTSTDGGANWTENTGAGARAWYGVASSADGQKLYATVSGGYIYSSTDGGANWGTQSNSSGSRSWYKIDTSADGQYVAAVVAGGYIYTSSNGGASWTERTNAGSRSWISIDISDDGQELVAGLSTSGRVFTSTDSGANWTEENGAGDPPADSWWGAVISSDGTKMAVSSGSTKPYYYLPGSATQTISSTPSYGGVRLSVASGTAVKSLDGNTTLSGNLAIDANNTLSLGTHNLSVTGTTGISGTISDASVTGTNIFLGDVTIASGGIWYSGGTIDFYLGGNLTYNSSGGFTPGSGQYYFNGSSSQVLSGSGTFTITNVNNTNTGSGLTISGAQPTITTLSQGANSVLYFSGTLPTITNLEASNSGNIVNYTGSGQTIRATTYSNLRTNSAGTNTLGGATVVNSALTVQGGAFATGDYSLSASTVAVSGSATVSLGSSTITLTGTGTVWDYTSSGAVTAGTSLIKLLEATGTATAKTFAGNGKTYNNIEFATATSGSSTGSITMSGDNTFASFTDSNTAAHTLIFTAGSTTTVTSFNIESATSSVITMQSSSGGSYWYLVDTTAGTNQVRYVSLTDSCASGTGVTWDAYTYSADNTNGGHNCGWTFNSSIDIGGTSSGYANGTVVNLAINGTYNTNTTINNNAFSFTSISGVSVGDILTAWVDNVADASESAAVTKFSSSNITGLSLTAGILAIGSNQDTSVSVTNLGLCDADTGCADEDIPFTSNSGALVLATSGADEVISVLSGDTLTVAGASSETITTEKIENNGTITASGSPTITLTGTSGVLFSNWNVFTPATSEVIVTSASGTVDLLANGGGTTFHRLTINAGVTLNAGASITMSSADANNRLYIQAGGLADEGEQIIGTANGTFIMDSGTTLNISEAFVSSAFPTNYTNGNITLNSNSTVNYSSTAAQTVSGVPTYGHLTISGAGTSTLGASTTVAGNLTVSAGTLELSTLGLSVTGTSSITGTLSDNSATGTNLFTGAVTINSGGIWTTTNDPAFEFRGGLTNDSVAGFTSGAGTYTFSTNAQTLSGTQAFTITAVSNTSAGGLILSTQYPTITTLTQGSGSLLTISSNTVPTITTLTATVSPNTVQYTGSGQTIKGTTYHHLTIGSAGTKTLGGATVLNGDLTVSGGTLDLSTLDFTVTGTTSVTGTIDDSDATGTNIFTGALTMNSGGVWTSSGNESYDFRGGLTINSGSTFTSGSGTYTFSTNAQTLGGTHASAAITNISNTITAGNGLSIEDGGITITALTQGTNAVLTFPSTIPTLTTLTATADGNTVQYTGGAQTVKSTTYHHLSTANAGTKTLGGNITINGNLTVGASSTFDPGYSYGVTGSGTNSLLVTGTAVVKSALLSTNYVSFETITPNSGSTFAYYPNYHQTVDHTVAYHHLSIVGFGAIELGGNTTITGNLTINTSNELNTKSYSITGSGTNTATISGMILIGATNFSDAIVGFETQTLGASSTVLYHSTTTQNIDNSLSYYNLETEKSFVTRTGAGQGLWGALASSSDGTKLVAGNWGGYIYTSTDSGATWTEQTNSGQRNWANIASSSDGTKLVAAVYDGYIYTSTDSGATWTQQTNSGSRTWGDVASSSDGTKLVAVASNAYIYTSTDSGVNWTQQTNSGSRTWIDVASSSDGTKLAAANYSGYIYTSTDSGANWTEQTNSGSRTWGGLASSSDGTKLVAGVDYGGYIYTSTDSGATWSTNSNASGSRYWRDVVSSADGTKLGAVSFTSYVALSSDGGITWSNQLNGGGLKNRASIVSSSDGTKLMIGNSNSADYLYTLDISTNSVHSLAGNTTVTGSTTIDQGTTLDPTSSYTLTGSGTNTLTVNGTAKVQHSTFAGSYPSFETKTLNTGSTVDYALSGAQTVDNTLTYDNLTISTGGTKTLGGATTVTGASTLSGGTLATGDYTLNSESISLTGGTFTPGSSTINLSGTGTVFNYSSGTYTRSGETINITDSSSTAKTFAGGGQSFWNVNFDGTGTGELIISGSNTFNKLKITNPPHTIKFTAGTTQNVKYPEISGISGSLNTLNSTSNGSTWTINFTPEHYGYGTYEQEFLSLRDSIATGNSYFSAIYAASSVDDQNSNTGWTFGRRSQGGGPGGVENSASPDPQQGSGQGGVGGGAGDAGGGGGGGQQQGDGSGGQGGGGGDVGFFWNNIFSPNTYLAYASGAEIPTDNSFAKYFKILPYIFFAGIALF